MIVNRKVNQVACGSLASTVSDSESDNHHNVNYAFFGPPVGSSQSMIGCIIKPIRVHKVYNSEKHNSIKQETYIAANNVVNE